MKALPSTHVQETSVRQGECAPSAMTLLITAKLIAGDVEGLCRVRNISATGMMIETHMALSRGEEVCVDLRCSSTLRASVAWARQGAAGLAFLTPVDVKAVLTGQLPPSRVLRARLPRPPRLAVDCTVMVAIGEDAHEACLLDISQSGAKLRLPFQAAREERLLVSIPGLPLKSGAVRWTKGAEAGLAFYEALPFDLLAQWIERRGS